jgi:DNA-binding GntR family transcriptional regulator
VATVGAKKTPATAQALRLPALTAGARQTAHALAHAVLRQAILEGALPGGTRLVQADLAEQLGLSTTPVREALRDLVGEGLIRFDPHRGAIVNELSSKDLNEIYDLRILLEARAIELAAERITEQQLDHLSEINDAMFRAEGPADWATLNRDFHLAIYEAADSPRMLAILRGLVESAVRYVSATRQAAPEIRETARDEHAAIVEKLRRHDVDGATAAIQHHLDNTRSLLELDA